MIKEIIDLFTVPCCRNIGVFSFDKKGDRKK